MTSSISKLPKYEQELDVLSPNRNIAPITTEIDSKARLQIGGCQLSKLAHMYGTPLYVLDEDTLRTSCKAYVESFKRHYSGSFLPLYASKANSSLLISRLICSEGFGLDAVSEGELITALNAGIKGENIVLHGNNKSENELLLAYKNQVTIVIDNQHDIDLLSKLIPSRGEPARLMLRFTPGIECHTHEYIKTGHLDSKFGFDPDQLEKVLLQLKDQSWASLRGLHAHIGSQIFELEPHRDLSKVLVDSYEMALNIGHPIEDINVGGGLGVKYSDSDDPPSIDEWVEVISSAISKECNSRKLILPRLICEPGRSLIAISGVTLYELGSRKFIPGLKTYLSIDGGMSDNPRPITYQSLYTACLADQPLKKPEEKVTIAGKHCESGDVLIKELELPRAKEGDILVVFGTGAYNYSMSSNYNRIPRPASIIVKDGHSDLIQRRERPEDLLQYDVIPERFNTLGL